MASIEHDMSAAKNRLNTVMQRFYGNTRHALTVVAAGAETACKERFVPVDTGLLRNSVTGRVLPDNQTVELRTNGVIYAAKQNFDEMNHDTDENDTGERGDHFIERGLQQGIDDALPVIKAIGKQSWGGS